MANTTRITEIITAMSSFKQEAYFKQELLPEYLELQKELVNLTFNDAHEESGKYRIWDVENHLEALNEECGHIADEELATFKAGCKIVCNAIKSEFSGNAGEYKAFRSLETLRVDNHILKNIEFWSGDRRTEIDGIVLTANAVFVVEVKNPHIDIYIDERGNYCRVSNTMHLDCNIGEKMNDKVFLLKKALENAGYINPNIVSLVVFTNSSIRVDNRYPHIQTCFLGDMPHIIENYKGNTLYSNDDFANMTEGIKNAECKDTFPLPIDVNQFKRDFATLMSILEDASKERTEADTSLHETPKCESNERGAKVEIPENNRGDISNKNSNIAVGNAAKIIGLASAFCIGFLVSKDFKGKKVI